MIKQLLRVEHGIDNYEEIIDIGEVVFTRTVFEVVNVKKDEWKYNVELVFRSGVKQKISMTAEGYEDFVSKWGVSKSIKT